jgi:hypothetical protein
MGTRGPMLKETNMPRALSDCGPAENIVAQEITTRNRIFLYKTYQNYQLKLQNLWNLEKLPEILSINTATYYLSNVINKIFLTDVQFPLPDIEINLKV